MERLEILKQFKREIENINITYYIDETYTDLRNACIDFGNTYQEWFTDNAFDEYTDREIVSYEIRKIMEDDDLDRLYYFLGDTDLREDIFRINAYGNLENITKEDLDYLKQDIIDRIDEEIENEESGVEND